MDEYNPQSINANLGSINQQLENISDSIRKMEMNLSRNVNETTDLKVAVAKLKTRNATLSWIIGITSPVFIGLVVFSWSVLQGDINSKTQETELRLRSELTTEVTKINYAISDVGTSVEGIEETLNKFDFVIEQ